jgi:hypothetical protein
MRCGEVARHERGAVTARALIVEDQAGERLPEPTRFRGLGGFFEAACEGEKVLPFRPGGAEAGVDEVREDLVRGGPSHLGDGTHPLCDVAG